MGNKIEKIGQRTGVGEMVNVETMRTYFTPKIEVNGKLVYVKDENTKSGLVETETKEEALEKAKEIRDSMIKKLENKQH